VRSPQSRTPKPLTIVKRVLNAVFWLWALSSVGALLAYPLTLFVDGPRWLELPWSRLGDFVEGANGKVYVSLGLYPRVLCYDSAGHFVASYSVPAMQHGVELSVGDDGLIYFWSQGNVFIKNADWGDLGHVEGPKAGCLFSTR